jgi:tripartite-type tricarboxylate transporter receptor subunit TctC
LFRILTGIDLLHVPFRGAGPASIDVIAGNTKAIMASTSSLSAHIRSGKLRGLAISMPKRIDAFPDLPTFIEAGVPEYEGGNWIGVAAPAGTPKEIIALLHREITALQDKTEVQNQMANRGVYIVKMSPAEFGAYMQSEMTKWGRVVKERNIKAE